MRETKKNYNTTILCHLALPARLWILLYQFSTQKSYVLTTNQNVTNVKRTRTFFCWWCVFKHCHKHTHMKKKKKKTHINEASNNVIILWQVKTPNRTLCSHNPWSRFKQFCRRKTLLIIFINRCNHQLVLINLFNFILFLSFSSSLSRVFYFLI